MNPIPILLKSHPSLEEIPTAYCSSRFNHDELFIPLAGSQLLQNAIAALHIVQADVDSVCTLLGGNDIVLIVAVVQACVDNIQRNLR